MKVYLLDQEQDLGDSPRHMLQVGKAAQRSGSPTPPIGGRNRPPNPLQNYFFIFC
ncbi:hypothetical protein H6G74_09500 [Nostoc spongiaeforme FACHB-130]|uniref:Uncharacterized protein n=1 Tax=Nostoc spongiaeforme FACHB-130 TaxID=1357510 RepID=A0ABR8FT06_9NOSO|nr:hypothetical protein [Nostoc spongiaeforme]MBD2594559.1 hypothetical protein [Nostoc spongiaeforme FACHB-130]